jgi:carboxylesterase type B
LIRIDSNDAGDSVLALKGPISALLAEYQHFANMLAFILSLLLVALPPIVRGQGAAPVIDVGYAKIAGFQNTTSGLNQYHGIRYAQNPTGPLRWRKPRAIEAISTDPDTVINATQIGPSCHNGVPDWNFPASIVPAGTTYSSEDCLLVDIFTPVNPVSAHLPVLLEIHGGGYTQGSAQSPRPDAMLYRANGTLVWASVQYRLGMFGFLAGNDIKENGELNAGLLDQRAGIEWVQRHIAAFGGDPDKITITGGSAGGGISLQPGFY